MKNKVLKTILIVALIIALTIADFVLLGTKLVTYALEDNGVKFTAYFKSEEGEESPEIEYEINNSEMKLYLEIAVESGVSFEGVITLSEDANFKFKDGVSQGISKIEQNKIILEPIRTGNTAKIEVGIEPVIEENYGDDMLSKESILTLSGSYDDGTDTSKTIGLEDKVKLNLAVPANIETKLEGKILTNKIYQIGEESKKIVQIQVDSTVIGNIYPIEKTTFEVFLPEGVENIEVISKGTYATNGEADRKLIENTNYTWDKANNKLQVNIENISKDNKISWKQDATDNIIITLILPEDVNIGTDEYSIKSKIKLYGQEATLEEKTLTYNLVEEADGIIRASIDNKESMYKGKLYSQEEREYNSTTNIEVNYANLIEGATIKEKNTYRVELDSDDLVANIEYKTTTILKEEFDKVLGENGILLIKDQNGNTVKEVKSTDFDTDGKLTITYSSGVKELTTEITKAIGTGIIRLNHTKVIKAENYTEEEIDSIKYLIEQGKVIYNEIENYFGLGNILKDVTSEVALTVPETISSEGNKEIPMSITLKTDNEKYKLFENPVFIVTMPEGVTVNSVSDGAESTLYGGLAISKIEAISSREIKIELSGKQTEYIESNINSQINFTAKVTVEKLMPNKVDSIKLQYQNKGNTNNIESEKINVIASNTKLLTHIKVENYNGSGATLERYSNSTTEISGELQVENTEEIEMTVTYTVINNYAQDIVASMAAVDVNYTNYEGNKTDVVTVIEQDLEVKAGEMKQISNIVKIPAGLYYGEKIDLTTLLECTYSGTQYKVRNDISLETEGKEGLRDTTIIDNKIQVETFAQLGDGSGVSKNDEVYNEQIIQYYIDVTNISNQLISNIVVKNTHENGNIYDLIEVEMENWATPENPISIEHRYAETATNTKVFEPISLQVGESKTLVVKVVAKKNAENNITSANISISADGIQEQEVSKISNKVKDANIKVTTEKVYTEEVEMYGNASVNTYTIIENLTDNEITNLNAKVYLSKGFEFSGKDLLAWAESSEELHIIENLNYNKEENYIEFNITKIDANAEIKIDTDIKIKELSLEEISAIEQVYSVVNEVVSNSAEIKIKQIETKYSVVQETNIQAGQKIKDGDTVIITGTITNLGYIDSRIDIKDIVPVGLNINKVELIRKNQTEDKTDEEQGKVVWIMTEIEQQETITIKIHTTVNTISMVTDEVKNTIEVLAVTGEITSSNEITLQAERNFDSVEKPEIPDEIPEEEPENKDPEATNPDDIIPDDDKSEAGDENAGGDEPGGDEPGGDEPGGDEPGDNPPKDNEPTYTISGNAWVDLNQNETKDDKEAIKGIIVKIIDVDNKNTFLKDKNGKEIEVKTNESGKYEIKEIPKGNYNLIFKYDTSTYELKSNSEIKDYIIESTKEKVAITNNINLNNNKTIDLKLMELTEFDLKVDKYISKVIVQNANGTKTSTYENQQLAKEEIPRKYLVGATVLVEYTIQISNVGELVGQATEIVDYLPKDMKFYSELNKQWYQGEDGNLYNTTLANQQINPGETKTIKLTLSKTMTKENVGTTTNIAEISNMMNTKEYKDIDSSNNQSKAEIIINIATGTVITYLVSAISSILILLAGMYIIKKKVIGKE